MTTKTTTTKCPTPVRGACGCPTAYSRCRGWVAFDQAAARAAGRDPASVPHGGWGLITKDDEE